MERRLKISILWFMILGALNGALISLFGAFFLDYIVNSYTTDVTLTYMDWLLILAPIFALVGAVFNLCAGFFFYKEEPKKKFLWFFNRK